MSPRRSKRIKLAHEAAAASNSDPRARKTTPKSGKGRVNTKAESSRNASAVKKVTRKGSIQKTQPSI